MSRKSWNVRTMQGASAAGVDAERIIFDSNNHDGQGVITRIPTELLALCLLHVDDEVTLATSRGVCRRWQQIIDETPSIKARFERWTTIGKYQAAVIEPLEIRRGLYRPWRSSTAAGGLQAGEWTVIAGGSNGTVQVFNAADPLEQPLEFKVHRTAITIVAVDHTPGRDLACAGNCDNDVAVFRSTTGEVVSRMDDLDDGSSITGLALSNRFLFSSYDLHNDINCWDIGSGELVDVLADCTETDSGDFVPHVDGTSALVSGSDVLVTGLISGQIWAWDIRPYVYLHETRVPTRPLVIVRLRSYGYIPQRPSPLPSDAANDRMKITAAGCRK